MNSAIIVKVCGVVGVVGCSWFWVFWFVGPHIRTSVFMQLAPALAADIVSIPFLLIAGRRWNKWFYVLAMVAFATWLVVGFKLH